MIHNRGYWLSKDETNTHDWDRPLAAELVKMFKNSKTIIDIGCGNGGYTRNFIENGLNCAGFDGSPLTPEITGGLCGIQDFSVPVDMMFKCDLVLSLEVGEHIPAAYESIFIDNLVNAAQKFICLSWAIEGQGGLGHVNCRNNDYVIRELSKRGFVYDQKRSDKLRSVSTFPWFKNTVMVFEKKEARPVLEIFKGFESSMVTVVLTSCGRMGELRRTIESFNKFNTFPIHEFIIAEDSGNPQIHQEIKSLYPDYTLIANPKNVGLVKNIDNGYAMVKTPYIFHCEDDWEFTRSGFIEKSLEVLLYYPEIMQVWIRALNDTNTHPIEEKIFYAGDTEFRYVAENVDKGRWHGFSWNPGLRRKSDYDMIGPFDNIATGLKAGEREMYVGMAFHKKGFRAAILPEGYVHHIGTGPKNYSLT
jgi:hypothetical protein